MKNNKYNYLNVIQQNCGFGWGDVSEYEADSKGRSINESLHSGKFVTNSRTGKQREITLLAHDLKEYFLTGYATRVIFRKEINELWEANKNGYSDLETYRIAKYAAHC